MGIELSDIVTSVNGRDKGKRFFVVDVADNFVYLCDGKSRRLEKPKRKKLKHVRFETKSGCRAAEKIRSRQKVTNSDLRRALAEHLANQLGDKGGM
ncbi:KOW domain-containing RNA-binding protein [Oscillospiraceae bacterium CM]|nr:KOW domain-containing RNA-binding protein [Oscillospiraceae bacterium CM]